MKYPDRWIASVAHCNSVILFISIGTSGSVYPAAGFAQAAADAGAYTLQLNLEESSSPDAFNESRFGPATELVPAAVAELITAQ